MKKYIFTGGPCVGKSTMLEALALHGYGVIPEASRMILDSEQEKERNTSGYAGILPWTDQRKFEQMVIRKQLELEGMLEEGVQHEAIFLDRALVDNLAYAELTGFDLFPYLKDAIRSAGYAKVFFLEQLPFYAKDAARKEDADRAKQIHEKIFEVYDRLGYDVVRVPPVSIEGRVQLILSELPEKKHREIENKYRANHAEVKDKLAQYHVELLGTTHEDNRLYDLLGMLQKRGYLFRLRNNGAYYLTLKGKDKGKDVKEKLEIEFEIPKFLHSLLSFLLPETLQYPKTRETYSPFGDAHCKICFDTVPGLGEFIEVEARSRNQVLLWEKRLGLTDVVKESYPQLVRKQKAL